MHAMYRSVYNLVKCDPVHALVETSVFLDKRMFPKVCMEAVDLLECVSPSFIKDGNLSEH